MVSSPDTGWISCLTCSPSEEGTPRRRVAVDDPPMAEWRTGSPMTAIETTGSAPCRPSTDLPISAATLPSCSRSCRTGPGVSSNAFHIDTKWAELAPITGEKAARPNNASNRPSTSPLPSGGRTVRLRRMPGRRPARHCRPGCMRLSMPSPMPVGKDTSPGRKCTTSANSSPSPAKASAGDRQGRGRLLGA
jgi:hypothetical protein